MVAATGLEKKAQDAQFAARLPGASGEAFLGTVEAALRASSCAPNRLTHEVPKLQVGRRGQTPGRCALRRRHCGDCLGVLSVTRAK